jgi:hypothetical protein
MTGIFRIFLLSASLTGMVTWGSNAHAAACASQATGNWGTAATWNCGHVPATGDTVTIAAGTTVNLNVNTNAVPSLTVNGTLSVPAGNNSDLYISGDIVNNGIINMQSSTGVNTIYLVGAGITSTFSGNGTWLLDNLDMNGNGGATACTGACKVELSGSPNLQFINATLFSAATAARTFNALGNSTATVTLNSAGNQTVATTGVTYPNLEFGGGGTKTLGTGNNQTINILGSMTIDTGVTASTNRTGITMAVAGNFINNGTYTSTNITNVFNGSTAQTIGGTSATTFNNLTIAETGTGSTTLLLNSAVTSNLSVSSGTLDLGAFTANRTTAGGTIAVANGATLMAGGTNGFPANYTTHTLGATSTVVYNGTNQSISAEAAPGYGYLTLGGSGTKTAAGSFIVRSDLTIDSGVTFASAATIQTVNSNVTNNGTQTATTGSITLSGGTVTHTLSGNGSYANLVLNDVLGATLAGSPTVTSVLTLNSGIITTGANTLEVISSCLTGIAGAGANNYVLGNLTLHYPAGTNTCTFPIGVSGSYTPTAVTMVGVASSLSSSSLTARTDAGDYPVTTAGAAGINASSDVNLYWTLTPGASLAFTSYNPAFTFTVGNLDGGATPGTFIIGQYNGSAWSYPAISAATATSTAATGITQATGFGVFVIGNRNLPSITALKSVAIYSDPVNGTTNPKFIPGAIAQYSIIAINSGGPADNNSTLIADPVPANTALYVNDIGGVGSGPLLFTQGSSSSTLAYTFTSLNSPTDNLDFSNDGGATWTYSPTAAANGCDSAVTNIRVKPQGTFYGSAVAPNPSFQLIFRVCVK